MRQQLIVAGREYVIKHNSAEMVAKGILDNLENPKEYDDYPDFFRNKYQPDSEEEIGTINGWTKFVKDCDWYKKFVTPGERNGLRF